MATIEITDPAREVLNQAPPLEPANLFELDAALVEAWSARAGDGAPTERARPARWRAASRPASTPAARSATSPG